MQTTTHTFMLSGKKSGHSTAGGYKVQHASSKAGPGFGCNIEVTYFG